MYVDESTPYDSFVWTTKILQKAYQKLLIELKITRKLPNHLMDTVQPLQEHGTSLVGIIGSMATSIAKFMSIAQPFTLN